MRTVERLACSVSRRSALAVLSAVIIIHLIAMASYINDNRLARRMANRDAVIQKIVNLIHLLEATPNFERAKAIAAMNDPDLQASISASPRFDLRFKTISFWEIDQALRKQYDSFAISIQLTSTQWLNVNATIYTHFLLTQLIFFGLEIFILGMILMVGWSINRFTKPIENFKRAAERLGSDLNTQPIAIDGPMVVQEAAIAMNCMQQRIQDLIRDRTQMLAAISHDLRTPITRLKLRAQFVDDEATKLELIGDLDEMESMVRETLSFARDDASYEAKVSFDIVSLIRSICDVMNDLGHHIDFESKQHQIPYCGRKTAIKRALNNLIGNATRYSKNVVVSLYKRHHSVAIEVEDNGPGIPEAELEQVFAPFYRTEQSRSRDTGGVGLGLAVTRDIVKADGGAIYLRNRKQGGLCATVILPLETR